MLCCAELSPRVQAPLCGRMVLPELPLFPQCSHSHVLLPMFVVQDYSITASEASNQWQGGSHACRLEAKFPANGLNRGRAVREGPLEADAEIAAAFCWENKGVKLNLKSLLVNPVSRHLVTNQEVKGVIWPLQLLHMPLATFFSLRTYRWKL